MGLDWHSVIETTQQEKEDYITKHYAEEILLKSKSIESLLENDPHEWTKPCRIVNAKKVKERVTFMADMQRILDSYKEQVAKEKEKPKPTKKNPYSGRNERFIKYWEGMTLESLMEEEGDKWDCQTCPLIEELSGADSSGSLFLGAIVSTCDFRGKRISAAEEIDEDLRNEAYEEHTPEEMKKYADKLEKEMKRLRKKGKFKKESYADYLKEYEQDKDRYGESASFFLGDKLSEEAYALELHWLEEALKKAIHWLRTCASHGITMHTSY